MAAWFRVGVCGDVEGMERREVAAFGAATVVFGLSRSFLLSLAALFVLGAADSISVVIRSTLLQVLTPDAMRGRVSAINTVNFSTTPHPELQSF